MRSVAPWTLACTAGAAATGVAAKATNARPSKLIPIDAGSLPRVAGAARGFRVILFSCLAVLFEPWPLVRPDRDGLVEAIRRSTRAGFPGRDFNPVRAR